MNNYEFYITAFMLELEHCLNNNKEQFSKIIYRYDEANTDKQAKQLIKNLILSNLRTISDINVVTIGNKNCFIDKKLFAIESVMTPNEYTQTERQYIRDTKTAVYSNPDLILHIDYNGKKIIEPLELKSTEKNDIPGSSIQQITPNEWVIFIKHNYKDTKIIVGKYKNTISGIMRFPDRSPRPQVSFCELEKWNEKHRKVVGRNVILSCDNNDIDKELLLRDWQDFLANRWVDVLKLNRKNNGEAWFNNTIRKFAVNLLKYYDTLTDEEKENLKRFIEGNILNEKI